MPFVDEKLTSKISYRLYFDEEVGKHRLDLIQDILRKSNPTFVQHGAT